MLVIDCLKEVSFEDVQKELLITDKRWKTVLEEAEVYYKTLSNLEATATNCIIKMHRDYYENSYLVDFSNNVQSPFDFLPIETILGATIPEEDLNDLEKPLIVAGLFDLITWNGLCFTEDKRKEQVKAIQESLEYIEKTGTED